MDRLHRDEWRELKDRAATISFNCDLVGRLPVEIVALIAEHVHLSDIILLRRVSHRWRHVLSSLPVCAAALRATGGGNMPISDPTPVIKRRLELERGTPPQRISVPSPLRNPMNVLKVGYSNGIYAWPEGETSIALLNLWTGRLVRLTTDNREHLIRLGLSNQLVAAISVRGYCHVWDINTEEHKEFRFASLEFSHFLVNGTKVALSYGKYLVLWDFNTESAHTIQIGHNPVTLALHPTEDQFTVICLREKENNHDREQTAETPRQMRPSAPNLSRVHTETFALDSSNEFRSTVSLLHDLPFDYEWVGTGIAPQYIWTGQSTLIVRPTEATLSLGEENEKPSLYLTADQNKGIVVHTMPDLPEISNLVCVEKGVIYAPKSTEGLLNILKSRELGPPPRSTQSGMSWSDTKIQRKTPRMQCHRILGDSDFVILLNMRHVEIWGFSDNWDSGRIESMLS